MSVENESAPMSEYREQSTLLSANQNAVNSSLARIDEQQAQVYPSVPQEQAPAPDPQITNSNSQPTVLPAVVNTLPRPPSLPQPPFSNHPKVSLALDYVAALFCIIWLIVGPQEFNLTWAWLGCYLVHLLIEGPRKPANRRVITIIFFIEVIKYFKYDERKFETHQIVLLCIYIIEVIPVLLQLLLVIWMFCCICTCACLCLCCCFYGVIRQSYDQYTQKARNSKIIQELCRRNVDEVAERQCPICLETGGQMATMSCHHSFHQKCLSAWLALHPTCPICRAKLY